MGTEMVQCWGQKQDLMGTGTGTDRDRDENNHGNGTSTGTLQPPLGDRMGTATPWTGDLPPPPVCSGCFLGGVTHNTSHDHVAIPVTPLSPTPLSPLYPRSARC